MMRRHPSRGIFLLVVWPAVVITTICGDLPIAAGENYALVVGVNACPAFRLPDGSQPRSLRGAENDADAMSDLLRNQFGFRDDHVMVLKGKLATHKEIRLAFDEMLKRLGPDDQFVFHFSGHGTQLADVAPFDEDDLLDEALCPHDACADGQSLLVDDELGRWLEDLPARRVIVILDSCHSGTGVKSDDGAVASRHLPMRAERNASESKVRPWRELTPATKSLARETCSLFACRSEEQAYERRFLGLTPPRSMGQFTHFLIEGLTANVADEDRDGHVSAGEIQHYALQQLDAAFNKGREPGAQQRPEGESSREDLTLLDAAVQR